MQFKGDISGLDEVYELAADIYFDELIRIGKDAIRVAQEARGGPRQTKEYQNRTWNLRNAPGACVVRDGKIVWMEVGADSEHPEAEKETENLLIYSEHPKDGLYIADGMYYASFVQSKGFDVVDSAIFFIENEIAK